MLWTMFVVLLAVWLAGVVTSRTFGGFIHVLFVLALAALLARLVADQRRD